MTGQPPIAAAGGPNDTDLPSARWVKLLLCLTLAGLLAAASYTSAEILDRQAALQRVSRYNVTWLASQASTELVRFQERVAAFGLPGGDVDTDEVQLRLDVLSNRVKLLQQGEAGQLIQADPALAAIVSRLARAVTEADDQIARLTQPPVRTHMLAMLEELVPDLARLAAAANRQGGDLVAKDQRDLGRAHWVFSGLLIAVLTVAIALLFFVNWMRGRFVRQLLAAKDAAEAANRAKSRFLANMSHELRTPMNGVLGMVELIRLGDLPADLRRFADIAHQSGKVMLDLIGTILDHSKIEAGRLELAKTAVEVHAAITDTADMLMAEAIAKGLKLTVSIDEAVPATVQGDEGRLRQVLINLIGNAIKFTRQGEVAVSACVVDAGADTVTVRFQVRDTGIGIAENQQAKVFEAFSQADDSSTRVNGGAGLGLAIARQLVELMGGTIGVTSLPREGSTFWFALPFQRLAPVEVALDPAPITHLSILAVTASDSERDALTEYLSAWGIWPVCTDSAERALTLARRAQAQGRGFDQILVSAASNDLPDGDFAAAVRRDRSLDGVAIAAIGGQGATVLPVPIDRAALYDLLCVTAAVREVGPAGQRAREARPIHALLVEDNPINRLVATEYLKRAGCQVDTAIHGREAVDRCRETDYDIVFMDCQMPEMDGFEATRLIRGTRGTFGRRLPIVALTGNAMDRDRAQCLDAGMDDFLVKPANPDVIVDALRRWVRPEKP